MNLGTHTRRIGRGTVPEVMIDIPFAQFQENQPQMIFNRHYKMYLAFGSTISDDK